MTLNLLNNSEKCPQWSILLVYFGC